MKSVSLEAVKRIMKEVTVSNEGNENNKNGLPYKLARVVIGKKSYIVFYVWNENTESLERFRRIVPANVNQKKWIAEKIKNINEALTEGYRIVKRTGGTFNRLPQTYSIVEALEKIFEIRQNGIIGKMSSIRHKSFINKFCNFLKVEGLENKKVGEIEKTHIQAYIDSLKMKNVSKNSYISNLKATFNAMVEREWIQVSPAAKIKKLKQEQSRSIAFASEDLPRLKALCQSESTELYIFCMFIFYTFLRPIELRKLKVAQVSLHEKKVYIEANQSKNKKAEYVMLPKPLEQILIKEKFLERPKNDFLFSASEDLQYSRNKFSVAFSAMCKAQGFPDNYKLYSWKHSGVVEFYKKGCGIKFIQMQCRHSSLDMTDKYLKSLGLFENDDILNNAPVI